MCFFFCSETVYEWEKRCPRFGSLLLNPRCCTPDISKFLMRTQNSNVCTCTSASNFLRTELRLHTMHTTSWYFRALLRSMCLFCSLICENLRSTGIPEKEKTHCIVRSRGVHAYECWEIIKSEVLQMHAFHILLSVWSSCLLGSPKQYVIWLAPPSDIVLCTPVCLCSWHSAVVSPGLLCLW